MAWTALNKRPEGFGFLEVWCNKPTYPKPDDEFQLGDFVVASVVKHWGRRKRTTSVYGYIVSCAEQKVTIRQHGLGNNDSSLMPKTRIYVRHAMGRATNEAMEEKVHMLAAVLERDNRHQEAVKLIRTGVIPEDLRHVKPRVINDVEVPEDVPPQMKLEEANRIVRSDHSALVVGQIRLPAELMEAASVRSVRSVPSSPELTVSGAGGEVELSALVVKAMDELLKLPRQRSLNREEVEEAWAKVMDELFS